MKRVWFFTMMIASGLALILFAPVIGVFGQDGIQPAGEPDLAAVSQGTAFTYQGNLKKSGQAVNVNCGFRFSLWDALAAGNQKGATLDVNGIPIQAGLFTVQLDFGNQFMGDARWLQTAVQCPGDAGFVTLAPRQPLNAVPYAISLIPGATVEQSLPNRTAIYGKGTGFGSVGLYGEGDNGVTGISDETGWAATYGEHRGTGGYGVYGRALGGTGVAGESLSAVGVYGKSVGSYGVQGDSTAGVGVVGKSQNANGVWGESVNGEGVRGIAHNPNHAGVVGTNDNGSYGVYGDSTKSNGVVGTASSQFSAGVYGEHRGSNGWGVYGKSNSGVGVFGESNASNAVAGLSKAPNKSGVYGENQSSGGFGVYGRSVNGTAVVGVGTNWAGMYGETAAPGVAAVWARNTAGGIAINAEGNAVQSRDKGGLVKAMVVIHSNGSVTQCYNGVTGATVGGCGFSSQRVGEGEYRIDFNFKVDDRFVLATGSLGTVSPTVATAVAYPSNPVDTLHVYVWDLDDEEYSNNGFDLIIF